MWKRFAVLMLIAMLLLPTMALADSPAAPMAYTKPVGSDMLFVMLASGPNWDPDGLAKQYPASGLYRKGETEPLWTVNWYAHGSEVYPMPDGEHLARLGPWPPRGNYEILAVGFYKNGEELRQYRVKDLVWMPQRLQESVSHYQWRAGEGHLDTEKGIFTVRTVPGDIYQFNVYTGAIIQGSPGPSPWVVGIGGLAGLLLVIWYLRRTMR